MTIKSCIEESLNQIDKTAKALEIRYEIQKNMEIYSEYNIWTETIFFPSRSVKGLFDCLIVCLFGIQLTYSENISLILAEIV